MMKRLYFLSFILMGLFFMSNSSCSKENIERLKSHDFGQDFELALNDSATLSRSEKELGITLVSVTDSRCPEDVQCVWAGNAVVKLELRSASGSSANAELCIGACNINASSSETANLTLDGKNYQILLKDVRPYPKKSGNADVRKSAVLHISKI